MITDIIIGGIGVVIGWVFIPAPAWAATLFSKLPFVGKYVK